MTRRRLLVRHYVCSLWAVIFTVLGVWQLARNYAGVAVLDSAFVLFWLWMAECYRRDAACYSMLWAIYCRLVLLGEVRP